MSAKGDTVAGRNDENEVLAEERTPLAQELRALPRLRAPSGPQSALRFSEIQARIDEPAFEARLEAGDRAVRGLLQDLPRLRAPESLQPLPRRRLRLLPARVTALAAAAALVAALAVPALLRAGDRRGLAAEAAALTGEPIPIRRIVRVDADSADAEWLLREPAARRGGP
jgi:hypothetical protein